MPKDYEISSLAKVFSYNSVNGIENPTTSICILPQWQLVAPESGT